MESKSNNRSNGSSDTSKNIKKRVITALLLSAGLTSPSTQQNFI